MKLNHALPGFDSVGLYKVDPTSTRVVYDATAWDTAAGEYEPTELFMSTLNTAAVSVATPTFDPDGGANPGNSVDVTVSCGTSDATIRYTTDGTEPTESSTTIASGGTVSVPVPGTLKAKAWKTGLNPSDTKTASYTANFYVSKDGNCDSNTPCYSAIQDAIEDAPAGSVILVKQGTYPESIRLEISKTLLVKGGYNSSYDQQEANATFIQGVGQTTIQAPRGSLKFEMLTIKPPH